MRRCRVVQPINMLLHNSLSLSPSLSLSESMASHLWTLYLSVFIQMLLTTLTIRNTHIFKTFTCFGLLIKGFALFLLAVSMNEWMTYCISWYSASHKTTTHFTHKHKQLQKDEITPHSTLHTAHHHFISITQGSIYNLISRSPCHSDKVDVLPFCHAHFPPLFSLADVLQYYHGFMCLSHVSLCHKHYLSLRCLELATYIHTRAVRWHSG